METYYVVAQNDYLYLQSIKLVFDSIQNYNPIAVTAQNVAERFLKHIIQTYLLENDYTQVLRSHKLITLYKAINDIYPDFILDKNVLRVLTDYYFDARYPGADYIVVSRQNALDAISGVEEIKKAVDIFMGRQKERI